MAHGKLSDPRLIFVILLLRCVEQFCYLFLSFIFILTQILQTIIYHIALPPFGFKNYTTNPNGCIDITPKRVYNIFTTITNSGCCETKRKEAGFQPLFSILLVLSDAVYNLIEKEQVRQGAPEQVKRWRSYLRRAACEEQRGITPLFFNQSSLVAFQVG